ncbi:MAG: sodium-independent anion transporter [Chlamydiae bacterium]|nr:sodium-independent anion transporter [Chlamydiota bacterium]
MVPQGVEVYEIQGPFFFGAANMLRDILNNIATTPKVFILRMRSVSIIDASGMCGIEEFYKECKKKEILLFLSGVHGQTRQDLKKFGLIDAIGQALVFPDINAALAKASEVLFTT